MSTQNIQPSWLIKLSSTISKLTHLNWKAIYAFLIAPSGVSTLDTTPVRLLLLPGAISYRLLTLCLDVIQKHRASHPTITGKINNLLLSLLSSVAMIVSAIVALIVGAAFSFITPVIFLILLIGGAIRAILNLVKDMKLWHQAQQIKDRENVRTATRRIQFGFANLGMIIVFITMVITISVLHVHGVITPFFAGLTAFISVVGTLIAIQSVFKKPSTATDIITDASTETTAVQQAWEQRLKTHSDQLCKKLNLQPVSADEVAAQTRMISWIDLAKRRRHIEKLAVIAAIQELTTGENYFSTHHAFNDLAQKTFFEKTCTKIIVTLLNAQKNQYSFEKTIETLRQIVPNVFLNRWSAISDTESLLHDAWQNRQFWVQVIR